MMEITFTQDGKPLSAEVTESNKPLPGNIGTGELTENTKIVHTDSKGRINDMVMSAIFGSPIPEAFGTPLAGSERIVRYKDVNGEKVPVVAAPTIEQIKEKSKEPYRSSYRQTLTVTLQSGAKYQVVFDRTLTNIDKDGKSGSTYTLTWTTPTISRLN